MEQGTRQKLGSRMAIGKKEHVFHTSVRNHIRKILTRHDRNKHCDKRPEPSTASNLGYRGECHPEPSLDSHVGVAFWGACLDSLGTFQIWGLGNRTGISVGVCRNVKLLAAHAIAGGEIGRGCALPNCQKIFQQQ